MTSTLNDPRSGATPPGAPGVHPELRPAAAHARRHRPRRGGFATVVALFLVGLVAAALTTVTADLLADGRRTRSAVTEAQLRQLLLAGGAEAAARSARWPAGGPAAESWSAALPAELASAGYAVRAEARPTPAGSAVVVVTATGLGHRATERVQFAPVDGRWRATAAALGGDER